VRILCAGRAQSAVNHGLSWYGAASTPACYRGIVLTMLTSATAFASGGKEINEHFYSKVFKVIIPRNVRLAEAPSYGKPVFFYDKSSPGHRATWIWPRLSFIMKELAMVQRKALGKAWERLFQICLKSWRQARRIAPGRPR